MVGLRRRHAALIAIAAVVSVAACSRQEATDPVAPAEPTAAEPPVAVSAPPTPTPAPAPPESPTVGGDGSAIRLSVLSAADLEREPLSGELGCSFSTDEAPPLLVAKGNVASRDPAQGLVKVLDSVERISAPGGFDAMLKGAVFSGAGETIRITLTAPAVGGGESPPIPATLTYDRADGASRTFVGRWECGP